MKKWKNNINPWMDESSMLKDIESKMRLMAHLVDFLFMTKKNPHCVLFHIWV